MLIISKPIISERPCVNEKYRSQYWDRVLIQIKRYNKLLSGLNVYLSQSPISESIYLNINQASIKISEHKNDMDFLEFKVWNEKQIHFNKMLVKKIINYKI